MGKAKTNLGKSIGKAQQYLKRTNFNFVNNKYLLYFILFLSICDLLLFAYLGEIIHVIIYILVGVITSFFTKNMLIVLSVAMVITNLVRYGVNINVKEGFEQNDEDIIKERVQNLGKKERQFIIDVKEGKQEPLTELSEEEEKVFEKMTDYVMQEEEMEEEEENEKKMESFKAKKKKETLTTKKSSDPKPADPPVLKKQKDLYKETQQVIESQQNLLKNMRGLEPIMNQAQEFVKKMESLKNKENKESKV